MAKVRAVSASTQISHRDDRVECSNEAIQKNVGIGPIQMSKNTIETLTKQTF